MDGSSPPGSWMFVLSVEVRVGKGAWGVIVLSVSIRLFGGGGGCDGFGGTAGRFGDGGRARTSSGCANRAELSHIHHNIILGGIDQKLGRAPGYDGRSRGDVM